MVDKTFMDTTLLPVLSRSMDAYALRQKAIANNVANVETPGYKRREVEFEELLQKALNDRNNSLDRTHPEHLPKPEELLDVEPELKVVAADDYFNGINNVSLDQEMASLSKTVLGFNFATRMARNEFSMLKSAIRGTNL